MSKISNLITIPFARDGDKVSIPEESSTGLVNKTQGFTSRYGEPPSEGGAYIKRESFNQILYTTQLAIQELQNLIITKVANKTPDVDGNITLSADDITSLGTLAKMNQLNLAGSEIIGLLPSSKLANASVTTDKLANASVTTDKLANASVTTDKIADGSITQDKLAAGITNVNLPIGFIYFQLRNQPTPDSLFGSNNKWQDISSSYAGEFFRAVGGNSASFGSKQNEGLPTFSIVTDRAVQGQGKVLPKGEKLTSANKGLGVIATAQGYNLTSAVAIGTGNTSFSQSPFPYFVPNNSIYGASTHVTPYNSAIRIWKKIA